MPHIGNFFDPTLYLEDTPTDNEVKKGPTSNWAFDHKADVAAHHAKYTDAEAKAAAGLKPLSVPPAAFLPRTDILDYTCDGFDLRNRTTLTSQTFHALVLLPHGARVTKLTLYGYRSTAGSILEIALRRVDHVGGQVNMATVAADWTDGLGSVYDDTIDYPVIDNENYYYHLLLSIDPDAAVSDCYFSAAGIDWS